MFICRQTEFTYNQLLITGLLIYRGLPSKYFNGSTKQKINFTQTVVFSDVKYIVFILFNQIHQKSSFIRKNYNDKTRTNSPSYIEKTWILKCHFLTSRHHLIIIMT